jgi:hypothetical protein
MLHWAERSWRRQDQSQPAGFVNYKDARRKGPHPFLTTGLMTPCCGGITGFVRPQAAVAKAPAFAALRSQRSAVGALQMGKGIDFPQVIEQLRALHLRRMLPCVHAHLHADPLARVHLCVHLHGNAEEGGGQLDATDMRIGLVTTRWNTEVFVCAFACLHGRCCSAHERRTVWKLAL